MSLHRMKDMAFTKEEIKEKHNDGAPSLLGEHDKFPFGLKLHLGDEVLDKLDVDGMPKVGDEKILLAKVTVTDSSENESIEGVKRRSISLQITAMELDDNSAHKIEKAQKALFS